MNVAIIAPTRFLELYCYTSMHLCYAALLGNADYLNFYKAKAEDPEHFVILDYRPVLPRSPIPTETLINAVETLQPDAFILPDSDFSTNYTIEHTMDFLRATKNRHGFGKPRKIGVLQGGTIGALRECLDLYDGMVDIIALPCSMEKIAPRPELEEQLNLIQRRILYLEIFNDPYDEVPVSSRALGVATSMPLRLAHNLRTIDEMRPYPAPLDFDLEEEPSPQLSRLNVSEYVEMVRGVKN